MATDAVMSTIQPGDHGGTYAGNLLTCRAGATVMRVIDEQDLVARSERLGSAALERLGGFAKRTERAESVRGLGLLIGLVLNDPAVAARAHTRLRDRGVLVNLTAERVLRLFPALNIPESELDEGLSAIEEAVENA